MYVANCISHFSVENLSSVDITPLNSPRITEDTRLCDLKLVPSLFIVLFQKFPYSVRSFSRDGNPIHSVVSQEQFFNAYYFCLDRFMNIIIGDTGDNNNKVFNREGQLVAYIGHEGTRRREFREPLGMDINKEGLIVVADCKKSHKLQCF